MFQQSSSGGNILKVTTLLKQFLWWIHALGFWVPDKVSLNGNVLEVPELLKRSWVQNKVPLRKFLIL